MRVFNPSRYERAFDVRLVLSGTVRNIRYSSPTIHRYLTQLIRESVKIAGIAVLIVPKSLQNLSLLLIQFLAPPPPRSDSYSFIQIGVRIVRPILILQSLIGHCEANFRFFTH